MDRWFRYVHAGQGTSVEDDDNDDRVDESSESNGDLGTGDDGVVSGIELGIGCRNVGIEGERWTDEGIGVGVEAAYARGSRGTPQRTHLGREVSVAEGGLL